MKIILAGLVLAVLLSGIGFLVPSTTGIGSQPVRIAGDILPGDNH